MCRRGIGIVLWSSWKCHQARLAGRTKPQKEVGSGATVWHRIHRPSAAAHFYSSLGPAHDVPATSPSSPSTLSATHDAAPSRWPGKLAPASGTILPASSFNEASMTAPKKPRIAHVRWVRKMVSRLAGWRRFLLFAIGSP